VDLSLGAEKIAWPVAVVVFVGTDSCFARSAGREVTTDGSLDGTNNEVV
jgi:hypothetical protein